MVAPPQPTVPSEPATRAPAPEPAADDLLQWSKQRTAADREALVRAASGSWKGPGGHIVFGPDGHVVFKLRGEYKHEGKLEIKDYRYGVSDGTATSIFEAFVDAEGKLHVATNIGPSVTPIDAQRRARIPLGMFKVLEVNGTCRLVNEFAGSAKPMACEFKTEDGVTTLNFDPLETGVRPLSEGRMVLLENEGLLVPPDHIGATLSKRPASP